MNFLTSERAAQFGLQPFLQYTYITASDGDHKSRQQSLY